MSLRKAKKPKPGVPQEWTRHTRDVATTAKRHGAIGFMSVGRGKRLLHVERALAAMHLRSYGEDEIAEQALRWSDAQLEDLGALAAWYMDNVAPEYTPASAARYGMMQAEAVARAGVELSEGAPRPLARKRRKLKGVYPDA